jgi:hypothetical protein
VESRTAQRGAETLGRRDPDLADKLACLSDDDLAAWAESTLAALARLTAALPAEAEQGT